MKILELRAENVKRLKVVTIKPDGNIVQITGKNGQGKTSVLDAIWWALEGQKNIQSVPIRKGAKSAKIKLDLGELKVTRTFNESRDPETQKPTGEYTTSIVVEDEKGARFQSPQRVIDSLLGALSFDPLAFNRMKPAEQLETLRRFVPGVDFAAIDKANQADYAKRTDFNRRAKELRAREAGILISEGAPAESVDESALIEELNNAVKHNAEIETRKVQRTAALQTIGDLNSRAIEGTKRIDKLRTEITELDAYVKDMENQSHRLNLQLKEAPPLPDPMDTSALRLKIDQARTGNRAFAEAQRNAQDKAKIASEAESFEQQSSALTKAMESRQREKEEAIAKAKMPIDGIGFGDGTVLMNGIPFEQASDSEQLRASVGIAAAMNPKLRVIRVRDGSLLDDDAMNLLAKFASENDLQIWIERVDTSGKVGFVLEDGELIAAEAVNG